MGRVMPLHFDSLYPTHNNIFNTPKCFLPISFLRSLSKTQQPNSDRDAFLVESEEFSSSKSTSQTSQLELGSQRESALGNGSTRVSHPWPEWVSLMELLLKRGYFGNEGNPFQNGKMGPKETTNSIRTACLNFSREQFGLIRYLSRKDIQVIAGCGCPSIDRKVVNSGKRLRAHVGMNEGNVCSSCNLRGNCDRAYVKAREEEVGRTVDVMRFLMTYGFNLVSEKFQNKLHDSKLVKESARRLLNEMVEYSQQQVISDVPGGTTLKKATPLAIHSSSQERGSIDVPMKQGDWLCPKCNFLNFSRNIRCLRCDDLSEGRLKQLREGQDHLPLKKGDWICQKCNFLNFAKNTRCLLCKEKPPKRHLNPGEWECESCNYINFRRNMMCLKCDHKRPKALNAAKTSLRLEHTTDDHTSDRRPEILYDVKATGANYQHATNQSSGSEFWRFVEEEREDEYSISSDEDPRFSDFPIAGGKSRLSYDAQSRERWKLKMLERRKNSAKTKNKIEGGRQLKTRGVNYVECSDDENFAEWFGGEKKVDDKSLESKSASQKLGKKCMLADKPVAYFEKYEGA